VDGRSDRGERDDEDGDGGLRRSSSGSLDPAMRDAQCRVQRAKSAFAAATARRRPWSPWIWAWIVGSMAGVHFVLTLVVPQHEYWHQTCRVCASHRSRSDDHFAWGYSP